MKKVLSLLVAFVFLQVQSWALSGGPDYSRLNGGGSSNPSLIGTYGGVLIPGTTTAGIAVPTGPQPASIGMFSISVPETGISTGVAIVFVNGTAFIGQIAGAADADKQSIQGLIAGTSNFTVTQSLVASDIFTTDPKTGIVTETVTFTQKQFPVYAQGSFKASVVEGNAGAFSPAPAGSGNGSSGGSGTTSSTTSSPNQIGSTNAARLTGSAQVGTFFQVDNNGTPQINAMTTYKIDGIKQNNIPSNVTSVPFSFSNNNSGS